MAQDSKERTYEADEIEARLRRELPHWHYENGWIRRTFRTSSWNSSGSPALRRPLAQMAHREADGRHRPPHRMARRAE
jgi:hypothetical protein